MALYLETPLCLYTEANPSCMSNLDNVLQGRNIYGIYITFLKTRSGDFVGTPPRGRSPRGAGARDYKSMRFQTYSHLWYPSGDPRAQAPLVGVTGFARLWSDALWAPYSLSEFKFYYEIFYPARDPEGEGCARPRGAQNELLKIFLQDPSPIGSWTTLAGSEYLGPTGHGRYYLFSTHSFPLGDQEILIKALSNRLRRQARSSLLSKRPMGASTLF